MTSDTEHTPTIRTEISDFCQEFATALIPVRDGLQGTLDEVQGKGSSEVLQRPLAGLKDVHHRLESLVKKVEEQQAYVIIFGPLKSGKSTLMNAISASYVSEVTSLPAYPCIVHVKHGDENHYQVTRYNGEKQVFDTNEALQSSISDDFEKLAARIREIEEAGEDFDPGVHCPEAIRRVDVEVPASNLEDSLAVLVDTPGLYTRMKFGYDLMTREFRNSAASAVFVVKTDNLFLEQVFDEFTELLQLFSRIFLVVNIDSSKRDLGPDGSIAPSLESRAPEEIVKAFESLVMRAPLRKAAEEGRLRIYPVDLLSAASASMKGVLPDAPGDSDEAAEESDEATDATEPEDSVSEEETGEDVEADPSTEAFPVLMRDLTDYLNSNDYLHEFMGDSLHQGKTLAGEICSLCSDESVSEFIKWQQSLEEEAEEITRKLNAIDSFSEVDWNSAFEVSLKNRRAAIEAFSKDLRSEIEGKLLKYLDSWFESDETAATLRTEFEKVFADCAQRIQAECKERSSAMVSNYLGGLELDPGLHPLLDREDEVVFPAIEAGRAAYNETQLEVPSCQLDFSSDWFKVKKGFWDWVLFRRQSAVRRSVLGAEETLDKPLPAAVKQRRLGDANKERLRERLMEHLESTLPGVAVDATDSVLSVYTEAVIAELRKRIEAGKSSYTLRKDELQKRIEENTRIQELLNQLSRDGEEFTETIAPLTEKYGAKVWVDDEVELETEIH
ncbi:MAG: dynamin family protein [Opitutales bacterium]|nr:dynamin family protein [Opitutales bacterium]